MCVIAIAYRVHPGYPVVIAANRDEFFHRPTAPLHFWDEAPDLLAGRDLQGRGTWLGVTRSGKIAAVTNYRDPQSLSATGLSRGSLVYDYLAGDLSPQDYLRRIRQQKDRYNGFNLLVGNDNQLWWYSNKNGNIYQLPPGVHVISNHLLNTDWPKAKKAKAGMQNLTAGRGPLQPEDFLNLLFDQSRPPDDELPDTGVGLDWERMLSPVFVSSEIYGTRSSSVILIDETRKLVFWERTFEMADGRPIQRETRRFDFQIRQRDAS